MNVLKTALEKQQWELAAYRVVLAAARVMGTGVSKNEKQDREEKERTAG